MGLTMRAAEHATGDPGANLPIDLRFLRCASKLGRLSQRQDSRVPAKPRSPARRVFPSHGEPELATNEFTDALADAVGIRELVARLPDETDQEDFRRLLELTDVPVSGLASSISPTAVTVTTYQSAKGREFDVVIMPGLVEGASRCGPLPALPHGTANRQTRNPSPRRGGVLRGGDTCA